jgi:hypothetical protein
MFWKILGKSTSRGQRKDSQLNGWPNTTENTETTLKSSEIYTKTNNMSLKTYQWIKGEKAGDVVKSDGTIVDDGGIDFITFTDGSRCNNDLIGDYIIEVLDDSPENLFMLNDIAPEPLRVVQTNDLPHTQQPDSSAQVIQPTAPTVSPLEALLTNSKKTEKTVGVSLKINVPPFDLIKVLAASFDDGQDQVLSYLQNSITPEMVEELKRQIAIELTSDIFEIPEISEIVEETQENLENYERV